MEISLSEICQKIGDMALELILEELKQLIESSLRTKLSKQSSNKEKGEKVLTTFVIHVLPRLFLGFSEPILVFWA